MALSINTRPKVFRHLCTQVQMEENNKTLKGVVHLKNNNNNNKKNFC